MGGFDGRQGRAGSGSWRAEKSKTLLIDVAAGALLLVGVGGIVAYNFMAGDKEDAETPEA
jgi:hypothetical protein